MTQALKQLALSQLNSVIAEWEEFRKRWNSGMSGGGPSGEEIRGAIARHRAAIRRVSGKGSSYDIEAEGLGGKDKHADWVLQELAGVAKGLRKDVEADFVIELAQLARGELFADYLEMAQHLLDEGYQDPAAVLGGSTLEAHVRQLCIKNSIDVTRPTKDGPKPKKADTMNADLAKASVVTGLDQKNVTAWLDLRNKAAHGKYAEYAKEQVGNMLSGIRDFLTRNPA